VGKSSKVTVGFKYYLGVHLALGYRVDAVTRFTVDDRVAWTGSVSSGDITVNAPELFGGKSREGGVSGTITVMDGNPSQTADPYLVEHLGSLVPGYRGICSLLYKHFYIGNNPYVKAMAWDVIRTDILTDGSAQWNVSKARIDGGDLNAAHIIRECLTNSDWGMDYPTSIIDDTAFTASAATLYDEGFGLTMLWNQQESIEEFVQRLLDHINGVLREDPTTGDIGLYLIRDDYTPGNLPLLDESNVITLESFERRAWGETVNEVTVTYHDVVTDTDLPVTVQDIGNIQIQGAIVNQSKQYPGIPNADLALRVAMRDLRAMSSPLSKISILVNRESWAFRRADVFRFSWAQQGLVEVVYRIVSITDGTLTDGKIKITAVEDVWGLPTSTYVSPQATGWTLPNNIPAPAIYQQLVEASYWDVQQNVSQADIATFGPDFGFLVAQAVQPSGDAFHYEMWVRNGAAPYEETDTGSFCPTAQLDGALDQGTSGLVDVVVPVKNADYLDDILVDTFAYIGTEIVAIKSINLGTPSVTIDRGVLDSVPVAHADEARIWFADQNQGFDRTERVDAESVDAKLLPVTGLGTLALGSATNLNLVLDNRYQRPYPPGNVKFNGDAYPATISGNLTLTWSHRDRTLQTAYLNDQTEVDIGPEVGTTYNLRVYGDGDVQFVDETGLTGTSYEVIEAVFPLQDFILNTWQPSATSSSFYNCNDYLAGTQIEDYLGSWNRTLYGGAVHSDVLLSKESLKSVSLPGVGSYIGQSDMDYASTSDTSVFAIVQFDTDLTGTRCIVQDGGSTRGFYFGLHGGNFGVWIMDSTNGNKTGTVTASTYINADEPVALGCCVDGGSGWIRLYVNGVKVYEDLSVGTFDNYNGTNGTSYGGCYAQLSIDGTSAPIGGMIGIIDTLFFAKFSGVEVQAYQEDEFWNLTLLNTLDYETEVAADSPYVRLKMDEASGTLTNSIGAYGHATPFGTVTYEVSGLVFGAGTAISLGTTAYLQNNDWADYLSSAATGFTVAVKATYPDSPSGLVCWFGINQNDASRTNRLLIGVNSGDNGKAYLNVANAAFTGSGTTVFSPGDSLHFFFTYDKVSGDFALYVNDVLEISGTQALTVAATDYAFIGAEADTGGAMGNYWASTLDEFLLFQTELTPARISVLTTAAETLPKLNSTIRVELESVRDTLTSRQMHDISVSR
jgi:hypothetical protein